MSTVSGPISSAFSMSGVGRALGKGATSTVTSLINGKPIPQAIIDGGLSAVSNYASTELGVNVTDVMSNPAKYISEAAINIVGGSGSGGGGGSDVFKAVAGTSVSNSGYGRLDYKIDPTEVELDTGIKPNAYVDYYEDNDLWSTPSLFLSCGGVKFPTTPDLSLTTFYNNNITYRFVNKIQQAVSFTIDFTALEGSTLSGYLNTLVDAMSTYLFWDSIITYNEYHQNTNPGMLFLRKQLTGTDLADLNELRFILSGLPIPPNLRKFVYFMNQTFRSGNLSNSSIRMFCPTNLSKNSDGLFVPDKCNYANFDTLMGALKGYRKTTSLLAKAVPSWITGTFASSNFNPIHSEDFNTIWANSPLIYKVSSDNGATFTVDKRLPLNTLTYPYSCFTESLDGSSYAMYSYYNSTKQQWTSLFTPTASRFYVVGNPNVVDTNRWTFLGSTSGFVHISGDDTIEAQIASINSGFTFSANSGGENVMSILPGSCPLSGVTAESVDQTAKQVYEWMMSFDTIPARTDGNLINNKSSKYKK